QRRIDAASVNESAVNHRKFSQTQSNQQAGQLSGVVAGSSSTAPGYHHHLKGGVPSSNGNYSPRSASNSGAPNAPSIAQQYSASSLASSNSSSSSSPYHRMIGPTIHPQASTSGTGAAGTGQSINSPSSSSSSYAANKFNDQSNAAAALSAIQKRLS